MIYKVKVRGVYMTHKAIMRQYFTVLVDVSGDGSESLAAGCSYVVNTAPSDVRWKEFEALEAAPFVVPTTLRVSDRQSMGRATAAVTEGQVK